MTSRNTAHHYKVAFWDRAADFLGDRPRQKFIALVLVSALLAFEAFNFDTTKFALSDLLGGTNFLGASWAAILAFAFCAIDFAGLVKIFTPEQGAEEPKEVWYLMGAWLLGATMNAVMTWYAVSLILANRPMLGNEVISRTQMLQVAPIFVAVLVWLTRILFIGSLSVAGDQLMNGTQPAPKKRRQNDTAVQSRPSTRNTNTRPAMGMRAHAYQAAPSTMSAPEPIMEPQTTPVPPQRTSRIKRRPPMPGHGTRPSPAPMIAKPHR